MFFSLRLLLYFYTFFNLINSGIVCMIYYLFFLILYLILRTHICIHTSIMTAVKHKSYDIRTSSRKMRSIRKCLTRKWKALMTSDVYMILCDTRARILSLFIADKHFAHTLRSRANLRSLSSVYFCLHLSNEASLIKYSYFSKFIVPFLKYAHIQSRNFLLITNIVRLMRLRV